MGRQADFEPGQAVVDPALGSTGTPSTDPSASAQPPASASAGSETAPAGQPGEATSNPTTAPAPVTVPAATTAPAAPPAPAPAPTPATPEPATIPETVDPPPVTPAPLTAEDVTRARQEAADEVDAKWRARQGGQDRQMNAIQHELEASRAATEEQRNLTRQTMLNREGLTPEEKDALQKTWELDDREKAVKELSDSTLDLHADMEVVLLLEAYKGLPGVTEEVLQGLAQEEREGFCKDQKIAHLESGGQPATAAATNGAAQPATASPAATPPPAAPAGASAPSDVGGAGVPPPAVTKNETPGADAMAENIGNTGWQDVSVRSLSGRR